MYQQGIGTPLTTKEFNYIADLLAHEELLMKQSMVAAANCRTQQAKQVCMSVAHRHQNHYQQLLGLLQEKSQIAP